MNRENVQKLIDHLRAMPPDPVDEVGFNMSHYLDFARYGEWRPAHIHSSGKHPCNTTACIAGHAALLSGKTIDDLMYDFMNTLVDNGRVIVAARDWLGLDRIDADRLFVHYIGRPSNMDAAAVLENLLETGEVDWSAAFE